jgi:hypothetical protein
MNLKVKFDNLKENEMTPEQRNTLHQLIANEIKLYEIEKQNIEHFGPFTRANCDFLWDRFTSQLQGN